MRALELRAAGGASPELEALANAAREGGARPAPRLRRAADAPGLDQALRLGDSPTRCQSLNSSWRCRASALAAQAARSEGLDALRAPARARRRSRLAACARPKRWPRCAGWRSSPTPCAACHAALVGRAVPPQMTTIRAPGSSPRPRSRWARTSAISRASWAWRKRDAALGEPVRLRAPGAALSAESGLPEPIERPGFTEAVIEARCR